MPELSYDKLHPRLDVPYSQYCLLSFMFFYFSLVDLASCILNIAFYLFIFCVFYFSSVDLASFEISFISFPLLNQFARF